MTPPPQQAALTENGARTSSWWLQWFSQLFDLSKNIIDYSATTVVVPLTGFSIAIDDTTQVLTLDSPTPLATGTIILPANPANGRFVQVSSNASVFGLTFLASGSETVANPPVALVAGTGFSYYYAKATTTWYKLS